MAGGSSVRIFFDTNALKKELNKWRIRKIKSLTNNDDLYKDLARAYAEKLDPYVPYSSKPRTSSHRKHLAQYTIGGRKDGIKYSATNRGYDYASAQYYADDSGWNRDRSVHPLARSDWAGDDVKKIIWKSYVKDARTIVTSYLKSGAKGIR